MASVTLYPSLDGRVGWNEGTQYDSFANARNHSGGDFSADDTSAQIAGVRVSMVLNSPLDKADFFNRSIFVFTHSISPPVHIESVVFSVWVTNKNDGLSTSVSLVAATPASDSALANTDFSTLGSTRFASDVSISSITTGQYTDFTLNASGLSAIQTAINGSSKIRLGLRLAIDLDNAYVEDTGGNSDITLYYSEQGGTPVTVNDPKLVITYTETKGSALMTSLAF